MSGLAKLNKNAADASESPDSIGNPARNDVRLGYTTGRGVSTMWRVLRFAACGLLLFASAMAKAQINSSQATISLNAILGESLTMSASPTLVNFSLVSGGTAVGSAPVAITTSWVLKTSRSSVNLYGWFTTPSAALTDGGSPANNIASSLVYGQVATGTPTSYTSFTQSNTLGTASGGLAMFSQAISSTNRASSRTDSLNMEINLATLPQLPAGTYTGTLTLQAQAL